MPPHVTPLAAGLYIRDAESADLPAIRDIYGHHVLHGLASFEETAPDLAEITRRFESLKADGRPYIAAVDASGSVERAGGSVERIVGYGYLSAYRPRPAYRYTVENSLYVAPDRARQGIGAALLQELIARGEALGHRQMMAVIGDSAHDASILLHERHGFRRVGTIASVGFKFDRWVDSVLLQRALGEGDSTLPDEG